MFTRRTKNRQPNKTRRTRMQRFEDLENRQMMAADIGMDVGLNNGVLEIIGSSMDDTIHVYQDQDQIVAATSNANGMASIRVDAFSVEQLQIDGGLGNDTIYNETSMASNISVSAGNDSLSLSRRNFLASTATPEPTATVEFGEPIVLHDWQTPGGNGFADGSGGDTEIELIEPIVFHDLQSPGGNGFTDGSGGDTEIELIEPIVLPALPRISGELTDGGRYVETTTGISDWVGGETTSEGTSLSPEQSYELEVAISEGDTSWIPHAGTYDPVESSEGSTGLRTPPDGMVFLTSPEIVVIPAATTPDQGNTPAQNDLGSGPRMESAPKLTTTDRIFGEAESVVEGAINWWNAAESAVDSLSETLATETETFLESHRVADSIEGEWGSAKGEAEVKLFGAAASTSSDLDFSDGNVSVTAEAKAYLANASASGEVTSKTVSIGGVDISAKASGSATAMIGAEAAATASLGTDGAELTAEVFAGAKANAEGEASVDLGGVEAGVEGNAEIVSGASAEAGLTANEEGLSLGASAFAGNKATAEGSAELGGFGVQGTAEAWTGVGVEADLDIGFEDGKLNFDFAFGAAVGIGGKVGGGFSIDFNEIGENVESGVTEAVTFMEEVTVVAETVGELAVMEIGTFSDPIYTAANDIVQEAETVVHQVAEVVETAAEVIVHEAKTVATDFANGFEQGAKEAFGWFGIKI